MREVIKGMVTLSYEPLQQPVYYLLKIAPLLAKLEPIWYRISLQLLVWERWKVKSCGCRLIDSDLLSLVAAQCCDVSCRDLFRKFRDLDMTWVVQVGYTLNYVISANLQRINQWNDYFLHAQRLLSDEVCVLYIKLVFGDLRFTLSLLNSQILKTL